MLKQCFRGMLDQIDAKLEHDSLHLQSVREMDLDKGMNFETAQINDFEPIREEKRALNEAKKGAEKPEHEEGGKHHKDGQ